MKTVFVFCALLAGVSSSCKSLHIRNHNLLDLPLFLLFSKCFQFLCEHWPWIKVAIFLPSDCPNGYSANGGSCYRFVSTGVDWYTARDDCANTGGYLARIGDAAEQRLAVSLTGFVLARLWTFTLLASFWKVPQNSSRSGLQRYQCFSFSLNSLCEAMKLEVLHTSK